MKLSYAGRPIGAQRTVPGRLAYCRLQQPRQLLGGPLPTIFAPILRVTVFSLAITIPRGGPPQRTLTLEILSTLNT
jgi:hypothetical protein